MRHDCSEDGHQLRVFKGGFNLTRDGTKRTSLLTCDLIDEGTLIQCGNIRKTWQEYVQIEVEPLGWQNTN